MDAIAADPTLDRLARVLGEEGDVLLAIAFGSSPPARPTPRVTSTWPCGPTPRSTTSASAT
jgi:hypothetical protein